MRRSIGGAGATLASMLMSVALMSLASAAPGKNPPGSTPAIGCLPSIITLKSGALDQGFGYCGTRVTTAADSTAAALIHYDATDLAIQADDKIVVVGRRMNQNANSSDTLVLRYTNGGTLDATFGAGGVTVVNTSSSGFGFESARGVLLQGDGAIVVVGTASNETVEGTAGYILRLTPAGAPDTTFGAAGTGIVAIAATKDATDLASDGAGGFYVVGKACFPTCTAQLTHVLANGTLDASFGAGGTLAVAYAGGAETGEAIAFAPGAIAVAGVTAFAAGQGNLGASRFALGADALASLDTGFSGDGKLTKSLGGTGSVGDVLLNPDLATFVGGAGPASGSPGIDRFALTRITPAGAATTVTSIFPSTSEGTINALTRTATRIYGAGFVRKTSGGYRMALAAYSTGGSLDATFSADGMADYNLTGDTRATAVGVQSSGRVVLAGRRLQMATSPGAVVLARVVP